MKGFVLFISLLAAAIVAHAQGITSMFPGPGTPAASGGTPIAVVAHASCSNTTVGCTTTGINTTGASLEVVACAYFNQEPCNISDSSSNTWPSPITWTEGQTSINFWYKYSPTTNSSQTFTVTCSGGNCYPSLTVIAFKNTVGSTIDQQNGPGTTQPGSITPTANNEVVVSNSLFNTTGTATVNSSMTILDQVAFVNGTNEGGALAYVIQTSATAINPTWGGGPAMQVSGIASFK